MEAAFGWIGQIFEFILLFFPRLVMIRVTHGGVAYKGKKIKPLGPGYYLYFPMFTEIEQMPVVTQTLNLDAQSLMTLDGQTVVAGGMVCYRISDYVKALTEFWNIEEIINDFTMAAIRSVITTSTVEAAKNLRSEIDSELTEKIKKALEEFGVEVIQARLTDYSVCVTLNHVGVKNAQVKI